MAVGADGDGPAVLQEIHGRENAVTQIGLGRRAQPGDGAGAGECLGFRRRHVGGVDRRPAVREVELPHQQFHRAEAAEGEAVLHLLHLLGDMDVDRGIRRQGRDDFTKQLRRHRPKRMGRDADTPKRVP